MGRKEARDLSFKALYQMDIQKCSMSEIITKIFEDSKMSEKDKIYVENVVYGTERELENIDAMISKGVKNWNLDRISKIDKAALRLAVYEIFNCDDIPDSISIFEAVELVKTYDSPEAGGFVNGILRGILRNNKEETVNKGE